MYPLTTFPEKTPLCALSAEWLNTVANMLNGLQVVMVPGLDAPQVVAPTQAGDNWLIHIPAPREAPVIPAPPASGDYVLVAQNGVLCWVELEEFECPE